MAGTAAEPAAGFPVRPAAGAPDKLPVGPDVDLGNGPGGTLPPTFRRQLPGAHRDRDRRRRRLLLFAVLIAALAAAAISLRVLDPSAFRSGASGPGSTTGPSASTGPTVAARLLVAARGVATGQPVLALQLDVAAARLDQGNAQARAQLLGDLHRYQASQPIQAGETIRLAGGAGHVVALRPDGALMAVTGPTSGIPLYDLSAGTTASVVSTLTAGVGTVTAMEFRPDGRVLAVGREHGTVELYQLSKAGSGFLLSTLSAGSAEVSALAFSPDGRRLAVAGTDGKGALFDVSTAAAPTRLARISARTLTFIPSGAALVTGGPDGLQLWQVTTAGVTRLGPSTGPGGDIQALTVDPVAGTVLTVAAAVATVWNISDPAAPNRLGQLDPSGGASSAGGALQRLLASPKGHLVVLQRATAIEVWDLSQPADAVPVAQLGASSSGLRLGSFGADGDLALAGSGSVTRWDTSSLAGGSATQVACALTHGGLPADAWTRYLPGVAYQDTCPA